MVANSELLTGLSDGELQALAEGILSPVAQSRLDQLLAQNAEARLSDTEQAELDLLLERVDQLTLLKARAHFTLLKKTAASPT